MARKALKNITRLPDGKYSGKTFYEVPINYLEWYINTVPLPKVVTDNIRAVIVRRLNPQKKHPIDQARKREKLIEQAKRKGN